MRRIISLLLVIFFMLAAKNSFPAEAMTEFRGIKWGTHISELKEMMFTRKTSDRLIWYVKKGKEESIGGVDVLVLEYGFLDGRFAAASITPYGGYDDFERLENSCRLKFGSPDNIVSSKTMLWFNVSLNLKIYLKFDKEKNSVEMNIWTVEAMFENADTKTNNLRKGW